jgi:hypothetical protein
MLLNPKIFGLATILCSLASPSFASTDISERIEFSGFGRLIGGYLDEKSADYEGYSDNLSFSQQSLFALQTDVTVTDTLSLSAQLLAHSSDKRESGIEWLYLSYEPSQNWRFKLGKLRTPFFRYSDVIDVGFAYPWILPPQQVYSAYLMSNYEGGSTTYISSFDDVNFELEAYYGSYTGDLNQDDRKVAIDVDALYGTILSINSGNFAVRLSVFNSSDFSVDIPELTQFSNALESAGFIKNAESLRFDSSVTVYQAGINYDNLDYFFAAEGMRIVSDLLVVPQIDSYYFTAGYNFHPFQAHVTYAVSKSAYNASDNLVPKGINPQLDQLSFGYDQIIGNLPGLSLDTVSLGLRWDFARSMAAKAEVTFLDGKPGDNSLFNNVRDLSFNGKATLYQVGLEWVF